MNRIGDVFPGTIFNYLFGQDFLSWKSRCQLKSHSAKELIIDLLETIYWKILWIADMHFVALFPWPGLKAPKFAGFLERIGEKIAPLIGWLLYFLEPIV